MSYLAVTDKRTTTFTTPFAAMSHLNKARVAGIVVEDVDGEQAEMCSRDANGQWSTPEKPAPIEKRYNQFHDPANGQFTDAATAGVVVPEGWERYVEHQMKTKGEQVDTSLPTAVVRYYAEYNRAPDDPNSVALEYVIREHGGIRAPLVISANDTHGLLIEGNHRLTVAEKLGVEKLPVKVYYDSEPLRNEGTPKPLEPVLREYIQKNKAHLPSFWKG